MKHVILAAAAAGMVATVALSQPSAPPQAGPRPDHVWNDNLPADHLRGVLPPDSPLRWALYESPPAYSGTGDRHDFDVVAHWPQYRYDPRTLLEGKPLALNVFGTTGADGTAIDLTSYSSLNDLSIFTGLGHKQLDFSGLSTASGLRVSVYSGSGNDTIIGPATGVNALYGGSGSDTIVVKGTQHNRIVGDYGADNLTGSAVLDEFAYYRPALDTGDTITGFTSGVDKIFIITGAPAKIWRGELSVRGRVEIGSIGWMPNAQGGVTIYMDTDGIRGADFEVHLVGVTSVQQSDFGYF